MGADNTLRTNDAGSAELLARASTSRRTAATVVLVSGGFDPLHVGHVRLIESAADYGRVWVALNSDEWLYRKKGYYFMSWAARSAILLSMRDVSQVVTVDDADGTVCEALRRIQPDVFVNGGDREKPNPAEAAICLRYGIRQVFKAGGVKTESSSELIKRVLRSAPRDSHTDPLPG